MQRHAADFRETGILLPNNQRQYRTSNASKDVLPAYVLIAVLRVSRSCELLISLPARTPLATGHLRIPDRQLAV